MTIIKYELNYLPVLKIYLWFTLISMNLRAFIKTPTALLEIILWGYLLTLALIYISSISYREKILNSQSYVFILFIVYLALHFIFTYIIRVNATDLAFYNILFLHFYELQLSIVVYFLALIFIPCIKKINEIELLLLLLLKISIIYTIVEFVLSHSGFRYIYEWLNYHSLSFYVEPEGSVGGRGIRFGFWRPLGITGGTQILGILHVISTIYMVKHKQLFWAGLSILALILSTSFTAYLVFSILSIIYLFYNRQYFLLLLLILLGVSVIIAGVIRYEYISLYVNNYDYTRLDHALDSVYGFAASFSTTIDPFTYQLIDDGPFQTVTRYFSNNPLELLLGTGPSYYNDGFLIKLDSDYIDQFAFLTSDFYFLSYFYEYGIVGSLLLLSVFFITPLLRINKENQFDAYVLISFALSTAHYPIHTAKVCFIYIAFSIFKFYLYTDKNEKY